jgi:hypothetical protein
MMTDTGGRTCLVCGLGTTSLHHAAGDYYFGSGQRVDYVVCSGPGCRYSKVRDPTPRGSPPTTMATTRTGGSRSRSESRRVRIECGGLKSHDFGLLRA